ncbi:alpha/beta fold hydrolase [Caldisalinibacter kiritimatiensis]|uniref:3-Oxoadipate enol-lactonase, alpha/beta hydrolase fold family n=1 Tax=Caldisalinibacter kiritimatiensis TaxID=1304284 RepID=R1CDG8_9FIRM|nr:alpha/beta hydrolase [Caldisalinibacter kiritimatiensis]EOD00335.1 3-Oxoadipate enol-lactonase, alpha/beta hydrolase fold family [Caldisalinibacter kiritimatiensis]
MSREVVLKSVELPNGETLGYRETVKGEKIVLLVHGNMTSSKHWDILIDRLPEKYKIYAVDLRGFGKSTYNKPINSIKDFSEDIKLFVDELGIKGFTIAGWSTGGGVSMQFTADYPEYVEKLILVESVGIKGYPIYKKDEKGQPIVGELLKTKKEIAKDPVQVLPVLNAYANKDKNYLRNLWNMLIYTHNQPSEERYEEYLDDMLTQRNLVDVDYALLTFNISNENNGVVDGTGDVDKINVPTLVIQGDRDYVVPMNMGKEIAVSIGDNAKLVIMEDSGHSPLIDNLDKLTNVIVDFIN